MSKIKDFPRVEEFIRYFVDPSSGQIHDLSKIRLLSCGVDTVRQLYRGLIRRKS